MMPASLERPIAHSIADDTTLLRSRLRTCFHLMGGLHLLRAATRSTVRILMYHRFSELIAEQFRQQCRHLARNYRVISVSAVADALRGDEPVPTNAAVITVDDGYRDFYEIAWPILQEFQLPATVFLVSGFVEGRLWLTGDRIEYAVMRSSLDSARIETPGGESLEIDLRTPQQRMVAVWQLKKAAKKMPAEMTDTFVSDAARQLGVSLPDEAPKAFQPMTREEARVMAEYGIEFGAHTRTHSILTRVDTAGRLKDEIAGSKRDLETWLGTGVRHFCYPNGDYDERCLAIVRDSGYETAVTTELGLNRAGRDCYRMRRIGVEPYMLPVTFRHYVAGTIEHAMERT